MRFVGAVGCSTIVGGVKTSLRAFSRGADKAGSGGGKRLIARRRMGWIGSWMGEFGFCWMGVMVAGVDDMIWRRKRDLRVGRMGAGIGKMGRGRSMAFSASAAS